MIALCSAPSTSTCARPIAPWHHVEQAQGLDLIAELPESAGRGGEQDVVLRSGRDQNVQPDRAAAERRGVRTLRRADQQAKDKRGYRSDEAGAQPDQILRIRAQMMFRQGVSEEHDYVDSLPRVWVTVREPCAVPELMIVGR